jgi:hypothetical protein
VTCGRAIEYKDDELAWLEANCTLIGPELTRQFNERFGRGISQDNLRNYCQRRGWFTGRTGCFETGAVPPNKGRKGWHPPGCEKGWFRKGQRSPNYRGPGHEYLCKRDGFVWVIVAGPSPYSTSTSVNCHAAMKHRHLWEQAHGPIPPKHVLRCKDGDRTNCDPANWWLIPQAIQPTLNKWSPNFDGLPVEAKEALITRALLKRKMREARSSAGLLTARERWNDRKRSARQADLANPQQETST